MLKTTPEQASSSSSVGIMKYDKSLTNQLIEKLGFLEAKKDTLNDAEVRTTPAKAPAKEPHTSTDWDAYYAAAYEACKHKLGEKIPITPHVVAFAATITALIKNQPVTMPTKEDADALIANVFSGQKVKTIDIEKAMREFDIAAGIVVAEEAIIIVIL